MSTGAIVAIIIAAVIILALVVVLLPRMRRRAEERRLEGRRTELADEHRSEAEARQARADVAERAARRERAEADLHEARANLHDQGLADDEIRGDVAPREAAGSARGESGDPTEFERGREFEREKGGSG